MLFWRVYTYWLPSSSFIVMRISRWGASEATSFKILFWKSANSPREWSLSANLSWKRVKNSPISEAARKIPLAVRIELQPRINSHTKPSLYWNQYSEEEKKSGGTEYGRCWIGQLVSSWPRRRVQASSMIIIGQEEAQVARYERILRSKRPAASINRLEYRLISAPRRYHRSIDRTWPRMGGHSKTLQMQPSRTTR